MKFSTLTAILSLSVLGSTSPVVEVAKLSKRDPCNGINAYPVLYHEYREDVCPAKNKCNPDGSSQGLDVRKNNCVAFCQVRTSFTYGQEVPLDNTYCHGPMTCTITDTDTATYTITGTGNLKFLEAFGFGVSMAFAGSKATAHARAFQVKLDDGVCGYFTLVPVRVDVCGSMTNTPVSSFYSPGGVVTSRCDYSKEQTEYNYCQAFPRRNVDGTPDVETIFVKTDCSTRQPLDPSKQDPVYQKPGVPLDRGVIANLISTWPSSVTEGDNCDVSYKFFYDLFEVRGKGWTNDELGPNGDNLRSKISGCGALTDWYFNLTPNDCCFQWYASGKLPIGVKNCVGNAVKNAGGPGATVANCHGAG